MKINSKKFQVKEDEKIDLKKWPTIIKPFYKSNNEYQKILSEHVAKLSSFQSLLYAYNRYSLLIIFQGIDAAGKDGAIKHVMSGVNPQGCEVFSFKQPSTEELEHDFLWRTTCRLPQRGKIGIFNRSYYEEVLVVRVHPELLHKELLSHKIVTDKDIWDKRYCSIVEFEKHLHRNGTKVIKFFLHLSKEEQRKRFLDRINNTDKNWKLSQSDINERKLWPQYMHAYETCLRKTSTKNAPWYIIPADDKDNARLLISKVILDNVKELKMNYPVLSKSRLKELQSVREQLMK